MARKVDVVICGKVITLKSNEEEAHLQRIARYIDQKMAELTGANTTAAIDERVRTLLIALNISNDYFKVSDKLARIEVTKEKYRDEIERLQQENALLREEYDALKTEHSALQAEHEEYIEVFDNVKKSENILPIIRGERKAGIR
ncbi:MAG: cell division protein ZapA [Defluviitaleaceae bacterium]|nr:cell division protein ZapA [Defluviitaleaceae bacterium]